MTQDAQDPIAAGRIEWQDVPQTAGPRRAASLSTSLPTDFPEISAPYRDYRQSTPDNYGDWQAQNRRDAYDAIRNGDNILGPLLRLGAGALARPGDSERDDFRSMQRPDEQYDRRTGWERH